METKKEEAKKQNPIFRVTQAPGFATGQVMHPPGTEIEWVVPDGWNKAKYGTHYAEFGPSTTFECVNPEAEKLMADHRENVAKKNAPKPNANDAEVAAQQDLILKLMMQNGEILAELRRAREKAEEKEEEAEKKASSKK